MDENYNCHNNWQVFFNNLISNLGYFIHDTIDMLQYEISKWTIELLLHHFATGFVMSVALVGQLFTVYAYQSLLMEVNR